MSRPPEVTLPKTDAERHEDDIRTAAASIRRNWVHMLPSEAPAIQYRAGRSTASGILGSHGRPESDAYGRPYWGDDWDPTTPLETVRPREGDIDHLTRVVSLRAHILAALNATCRIIMEDRPITNPASLPTGDNAQAMCEFIETHAQWLGPQDCAEDVSVELADFERRVDVIVNPPKREHHTLGRCPFVVGQETADRMCRGKVTLPIIGDIDAEAVCDGCEQHGPVDWWEIVFGRDPWWVATLPELTRILRARLNVTVTEQHVRRWVAAGRIHAIAAFGPQPLHRRFDVRLVLDEVARFDHECVMCGRPWSGQSDLCTRCYVDSRTTKPQWSEPPPAYAVGTATPPAMPVQSCALAERQRCQWSASTPATR